MYSLLFVIYSIDMLDMQFYILYTSCYCNFSQHACLVNSSGMN